MYLSVVTTSYNSRSTITKFIDEISKTVLELNISDYEIIIVDDGSTDETIQILKDEKKKLNDLE